MPGLQVDVLRVDLCSGANISTGIPFTKEQVSAEESLIPWNWRLKV